MADSANIARHLPLRAAEQPDRIAIKVPRGRDSRGHINYLALTYRELDAETVAWSGRLQQRGVRAGDRVLVMVRQGLPLIAAVFALFRLGAVPVIIDPGMGRKNFLACVTRTRPRVLLGIPYAQILSHLFRAAFRSVEIRCWVSSSPTHRQSAAGDVVPPLVDPAPDSLAAILFTSGSTGAPKGVCYRHSMLDAQVAMIRAAYAITPGEIDLPLLPIFALFGPALGLTTIVPEFDPSRPASLDPAKIVQAIEQEKVTTSFGSPTLWRKIFDYCLSRDLQLKGMKRILCAGAAVPGPLWADARKMLPNGMLHSPYGATEALPVASCSADELDVRPDLGALVGQPLPGSRVKIIALHDGPIAALAETRELPPGECGEIVVAGPVVSREYDRLPEATAAAKIAGPDEIWHRMGDAGLIDSSGRLWFQGRVAERIETASGVVHTEPAEQVFRGHAQVARCALIGLGPPGEQEPALVVQPVPGATGLPRLARTLRELAQSYPHTQAIRKFLFHPAFPVDVRHNAKIHRLTLTRWAATARIFEPRGGP